KLVLQPLKATSLTLPTDLPNTTNILAFRMPGLDSPDYPALEVLADVLSSHRFALYDLVSQGKAISTEFALVPLPKAGLAYAAVSIPADTNPADSAAKIRAILADTIRSGVSADLVAAAQLQEIRDTEFQKNSIEGLASAWADALALEGLPSPDADLARIEKVTVADVNRVARKYLRLDQAIDATMMPQKSGQPISGAGFGGQESFALPSEKPASLPDWAQPLLAKVTVPPSTLSPLVSTLPNGLTLIVQPETVSDTVTVYGHVRNQPELEEPTGKDGVSLMLDQLLDYGTEHLDRLAFQGALDAIGADESAGTVFYARALAPHFERATELLADNELHPSLPADGLENVRARVVPYIGSRNTTPQFLAQQALRHALYPESDPSLRNATPATIQKITLDDVKSYFHSTYRPDLTTIVVIGKVDPERAKAVIGKYFGGWTASGPTPVTDLSPAPPNAAGSISVPDSSRVQDTVSLAQTLALPRSDPDYYALSLGNAILSGGFYSSRFSIDLRKNAGLVYSVSGSIQPGRLRSIYLVNYASDPENVGKAAQIAAQDIHTLQITPPPDGELERAKALLLQQIVLNEGSLDDIARLYLSETSLGLPVDETTTAAKSYVALSPTQVQAAFSKWMRPQALARVSRGPAAQ
ncbi:MAG TPA: insulinase family protein, partial [Rhizomicrobium sp.]|nr:insulinase family protein [Rhizomicrobium sp.]